MIALLLLACSVPLAPVGDAGDERLPIPAPCAIQTRAVALSCLVEQDAPPRPGSAVQLGTVLVEQVVAEGVAEVDADCWVEVTWVGTTCAPEVVGYLDELEVGEAPGCGCVDDETLEWGT